jgi:multiple sugar transport system substrate-binding protein
MRIRSAVLAVPLVLAVVLVGCGRDEGDGGDGNGGQASQPPAPTGEATGTIQVWAMGTEGENLDTLAEQFMEENGEITVEVTAVPWDAAHDRIVNAIAGGEVPDISLIGTTWMGEFAELGGLDPTPDTFNPDDFFEGAWNTTVVEGTSYGVPWYVETRVLYYRTDLAEQAGFSEPPGDWDQLKEMVIGMQEAGAQYGINLQPGGTGAWQTWMPFFWSAGGQVMDDGGNFTLDSEACTESLTYYDSYFEEGLTASEAGAAPLEGQFAEGQVGSFISGPWMIGLVTDAGAEEGSFNVATLPENESATSFVGGGNLAVFSDSDNKAAAWAFIEYLSRPEVQVTWYETVNDLPSTRAAWEDEQLSGDEMLSVFGEQLDSAISPPSIPTWEQIAAQIDAQIEQVTVGDAAPEEACATMQQEASSIGTGF